MVFQKVSQMFPGSAKNAKEVRDNNSECNFLTYFRVFYFSDYFFLEGYFCRPSLYLNSQEILSNTLNYYAMTGR